MLRFLSPYSKKQNGRMLETVYIQLLIRDLRSSDLLSCQDLNWDGTPHGDLLASTS